MIALFLLVATLSLPPGADPTSGCVWIRAENDSSGTGFIVDREKGWILTCRHVVADRDHVDVFLPWHREGSLVTEKDTYLGHREHLRSQKLLLRAKVLKKTDEKDLALLQVDSLPESVHALSFARAPASSGEPLRVIGHRIDLDTLFNITTGPARVSGPLANGYPWRGKTLSLNADVVLGQLPIEEGDSGGPVLNAKGEVVGMVAALRRSAPLAAVAISAAEIRTFIGAEKPRDEPPRAGPGEPLIRSTVWIRPNATEVHLAGVLIDRDYILTSSRGLGASNVVGIAFPLRENGRWVGDRKPYQDLVGLYLKNAWSRGVVVARDADRDLALIAMDEGTRPAEMKPLPLAARSLRPGDAVQAMSHPGGVEFAWVFSSGSVRQTGRLALGAGERPARVNAALFQLPAQAGSPGGPIANDAGELVGVLSMRESNQQAGYAATPEEIAAFLDAARPDHPPRSLAALANRVEVFLSRNANELANALGHRANQRPLEEREWMLRMALFLDPHAFSPRSFLLNTLMKQGRKEEAEEVLERGIENNDIVRSIWLELRAYRRIDAREWRGARGDLERILEVYPRNTNARRLLIRVLLELNKDDEAATAVRDTVRVHADGYRYLATDLLRQADELARKFPDAPAVPANWLTAALTAARNGEGNADRRTDCEAILKAAAFAAEDSARLKILRDFLSRASK